MSKFAQTLPKLLPHWCQQVWSSYYFKFVLSKIQRAEVDGIALDLSAFTPRIRNRIVNLGYEQAEKEMCSELLSPDDAVLEIGGGIGFIGLFCQMKLGIKNYITVEANPATIEILQRNYALNGISPVVWNFAVAPESGTVRLNVGGDFWEHSTVASRAPAFWHTIEVPAAPLPDLIQCAGPAVNVLIIDIEGAERGVDFSRLPEHINKIIFELHPRVIGTEGASDILGCLVGGGFKVVRREADTFALLRS